VIYSHQLTFDEKRELLRIARATLREFLRTGRLPPGKPHRPSLLAPAAVFVSLHVEDSLRGCIGTTEARHPIYQAIQEMAVSAATRDPRFPPMTVEELAEVAIEVSVLGELRRCDSATRIEIGVDGVVIEGHGHRGLLLPQVARDAGWTAEQFLGQTCRKAGLPADSWRTSAVTAHTFRAQVFGEKQMSQLATIAS
jgi:AmmeMemoRadiSam system protein A